MQYEFAPLEGITGYIYRNAHHACFPSMDRYYTPFITPKKGKSFTTREWNDIAAEHNQNIAVVPQILTNQAESFCKVRERELLDNPAKSASSVRLQNVCIWLKDSRRDSSPSVRSLRRAIASRQRSKSLRFR